MNISFEIGNIVKDNPKGTAAVRFDRILRAIVSLEQSGNIKLILSLHLKMKTNNGRPVSNKLPNYIRKR